MGTGPTAWLCQIDANARVGGAATSIRLASHDDDRLCHLDPKTPQAPWWPSIARLPTLSDDFFDGAFGGDITAPSGRADISIAGVPGFASLMLHGARIRWWVGELGAAWGDFVLRFDGLVENHPAVRDGVAGIEFRVDDRWLDDPILSTYAGTTGAEGESALKGQVKPLLLGMPRFVEGVLVDSIDTIIQLNDGPIAAVDVAFEDVARFAAPVADYATFAALDAATIAPGFFATCLAGGYVRHGAPLDGVATYHVQGSNAGTDGGGLVRRTGAIVKRIAARMGRSDKLDTAALTAIDTARPWNISVALTAQTTMRELVQSLAQSINAVARVSWTGLLTVLPIDPPDAATPVGTLASDGSALPPVANVAQLGVASPWWRVAIEAEVTERVHGNDEIRFTANLVERGIYDDAETYREGNIVSIADGSRWLYTSAYPTAGNDPSDVSAFWSRLSEPATGPQGPPGATGAPGAPGADGITYYAWYAYADAPDGTFNFTTGAPGGRSYQGIATGKTTATESMVAADYDWSPYVGPPSLGLANFNSNSVLASNKLIKVSGGTGWDASVHSTESFKGGASVSFVVDALTTGGFVVGLNTDPTTDADYASIDFGIAIRTADVRVFEAGTGKYSGAAAVVGDVFAVTYNGKTVVYSKNGVPFYTNAAPGADLILFLDTAMATTGTQFGRILSFVPAGTAGADGAAGANGLNNAVVYLYRRGATSPAVPTGTFTFTFSTGVLSGGTLNGWTQAVPAADGNPLWVIAATASSATATDSIAAAEFSSPVLKDGAGLNAATIFLYQRATSAPGVPGATTTYTFATGVLTGTLGSWTQTVPANDGNPLYIITATALGAAATDTIATGEWSAVRVLAENGAQGAPGTAGAPGTNGTNGADGITYYDWYSYADAPDGSFNFTTGAPGSRSYQGVAKGKTTATESTNYLDYDWSPYVGPPNFGLASFNANTVLAGGKLIKTGGGTGFDGSIHSTESYKGGASVSFVVDALGSGGFLVGLNTDPTTDADFASIDFAIAIRTADVRVFESGTGKYSGAAAVVGDVFTVTYNGRSVVYSKNGTPFYTNNSPAADLVLFLDSSIATKSVQLATIKSFGAAGTAGADGLNNAVVMLYRRGATAPAAPSGTFTFTFATGVLSGGTLNGWTQAVPAADGNPLWVIAATASASAATDSIAAAEFSSPVQKDGAGLNAATVFLYQRVASAPTAPGTTTTYTFATGVLTGTLGSWTQTVPAHNGNPLYVITATALGTAPTDTIATGEWSAVRVLAENGANGISPVVALASPASKQFAADADGTIKTGQLPFSIAIAGTKAGASIGGTVAVLTVSGCTATAASGGFTIDTVTADEGYVEWQFTATDAQVVTGKVSFSRQRDPTGGGEVLVNFSSTSWWGSGSYASSGPSTVLPASSTGKLRLTGYASFYASTNGTATLTGKLQYRAVGSGTWIDSGYSGSGVATRLVGVPGEPDDNTPGVVSIGGTVTGLTAEGSYEVQMVGNRSTSGTAISSATGFISLKQVA